eukprot:COSAG06_NODE_11393_length_1516_cov_1.510939_3_plen_311_part_00
MTSVTGTSTIPKRPLFEDGPEVSVIGFGAWPIGGGLGAVDADVGLRAVQVAVDVGQSFIDTAEYYERAHEYGNKTNKQGGSETVIGRALTAAPSLKEQAFVTTKCTLQPYTEEKIRSACAYSMEKLQADCIELYQLHGWDPATPVADQLGVLAALQEEGKIKYIGLNNAGVKQLDEAWATGIRFHTLQVRYHMFSRKEIEAEIAPWYVETSFLAPFDTQSPSICQDRLGTTHREKLKARHVSAGAASTAWGFWRTPFSGKACSQASTSAAMSSLKTTSAPASSTSRAKDSTSTVTLWRNSLPSRSAKATR